MLSRIAIAMLLLLCVSGAQAQDKTVQLKLSSWVPPAHPLNPALQAWGEDIDKASGGTIKSTLFPAEQLGKAMDHFDMVRDGIAETVQVLALLLGSLGKIALDVMLMSATEFGEAAEPFVQGRGSSSTMPQKRNPISCELILAAAKVLRQQAGLVLDALVTDFERATGPWHVEWVAVPEAFGYAAGALHQARFMLGGLIVDTDRMAKNLAMTHGLIVAEAVMMGLAPHTGRNEAHDLVYDACRLAIDPSSPPLRSEPGETPKRRL